MAHAPGAGGADWPTGADPLPHDEATLAEAVALVGAATAARRAGDHQRATVVALEALGRLGQRLPDLLEADLEPGVLDAEALAAVTGDLLDAVLGHPSTLLATYGSLRPGGSLHHVVAPLGGAWTEGELRGDVRVVAGYPVLRWHRHGAAVPASLLRADALRGAWPSLDEVEGPRYRRAVVLAWVPGGPVAATAYVDAADGSAVTGP